MRRALPPLLLAGVLGLTGCSGGEEQAAPAPGGSPAPTGYSALVRTTFLDSCVDNARNSSRGAASEEQLTRTCECILTRVEQAYTEAEFAEFEKRLLGGDASGEESDRLASWSTACAREAAG